MEAEHPSALARATVAGDDQHHDEDGDQGRERVGDLEQTHHRERPREHGERDREGEGEPVEVGGLAIAGQGLRHDWPFSRVWDGLAHGISTSLTSVAVVRSAT